MMKQRCVRRQFFLSVLLLAVLSSIMIPAQAEWYVAGQAGHSFADSLRNVTTTGPFGGDRLQAFDMKNSLAYGGKVGVYPFHGSLGFELDVNHSTPHVKNIDSTPGFHLGVTNVGVNILFRYPGTTFQPYLGLGPGILIARLGRSVETESDTQVSVGFNFLTGVRAFVTPNVALFTEYKYTDAKFGFDDAFVSCAPFSSCGGFDSTYRAHQLFLGVSYHF